MRAEDEVEAGAGEAEAAEVDHGDDPTQRPPSPRAHRSYAALAGALEQPGDESSSLKKPKAGGGTAGSGSAAPGSGQERSGGGRGGEAMSGSETDAAMA